MGFIEKFEFRRFKSVFIQRNHQMLTSILLFFKNFSVIPRKLSCFTLDPKKWDKKITKIFFLGGKFNIIFWRKDQRKFSGFIKKGFRIDNARKNKEKKEIGYLINKISPLYSEAELTMLDGFIQFRNRSVKFLPIQIVPENLWASFSSIFDFSYQIEKQTRQLSRNFRKLFPRTKKVLQEATKFHSEKKSIGYIKSFFFDLVFRKREF